jgi:CBS domain-containing protein
MNNDSSAAEERIAEERARTEMRLAMAGVHRPVGDLPTRAAALTCEHSATVRQAIGAMQRARTGCLLILDQGHFVGVGTERDVLATVAAQEVDLDPLRGGALMPPQPECLPVDDALVYALNQMSVGGYRSIPRLDDQGHPTRGVSERGIWVIMGASAGGATLVCPPVDGGLTRDGRAIVP